MLVLGKPSSDLEEFRHANGTLPRLEGNFVFNPATEELTRDGKPCKYVKSATMIEDRFGLPVFQVGPDDRALLVARPHSAQGQVDRRDRVARRRSDGAYGPHRNFS